MSDQAFASLAQLFRLVAVVLRTGYGKLYAGNFRVYAGRYSLDGKTFLRGGRWVWNSMRVAIVSLPDI